MAEHIITETEKAYVAGLVDGEGSIQIVLQTNKSRGRPEYCFAQVCINNCNRTLLEWVKKRFGGKIIVSRRNYNSEEKNSKPLYKLYFYRKEARHFFKLVLPYLVLKRKQALVVEKLFKKIDQYRHPLTPLERRSRKSLYWKCRLLNARGLNGIDEVSRATKKDGF